MSGQGSVGGVSLTFASWNQMAGLAMPSGSAPGRGVNRVTTGPTSRKLELGDQPWQRSIGPSVPRSRASPTGCEDLGIDEVIERFDVTREQVAAVLAFVAQSLRASDVHAGAHPV